MAEKLGQSDSVVTEEQVRQVLAGDKGSKAHLTSWKLVNFTKQGDNFGSTVSGIETIYSLDDEDEELEAFYVVKYKSLQQDDIHSQTMRALFLKEGQFYKKLLPELNGIMRGIGQPQLNFPKSLHQSLDVKKEQIHFEDLRKRGFILFDKRKGMDVPHAKLVLREVARLHAASLLLEAKYSKPIEARHDFMLQDVFSNSVYAEDVFFPMVVSCLSRSVQMLERFGGYEKAMKWIEGLKPQVENMFKYGLKSDGYNVVTHGDCWNNNILFRYDNNGSPEEVMLIDLQICRKASLATELNYFLYCSLTSNVRRTNLTGLLKCYHKAFQKVMEAGGRTMPFTEEDLLTEYKAKNKLGAVFAMTFTPFLLMESQETPDVNKYKGNFKELVAAMNRVVIDMLDTNPLLKLRFLSTVDEFMEIGLIE